MSAHFQIPSHDYHIDFVVFILCDIRLHFNDLFNSVLCCLFESSSGHSV